MRVWEDYTRTCMHGIKEGLDYHSCTKCETIARKLGKKLFTSDPEPQRKTYIFTSQLQVDKLTKNKSSDRIPEGCEFCKHISCYNYKGRRFKCAKKYNLLMMEDDYDCPSYESGK